MNSTELVGTADLGDKAPRLALRFDPIAKRFTLALQWRRGDTWTDDGARSIAFSMYRIGDVEALLLAGLARASKELR